MSNERTLLTRTSRIRVAVRIRPLSDIEKQSGGTTIWNSSCVSHSSYDYEENDSNEIEQIYEVIDKNEHPGRQGCQFNFDYICPQGESTTKLYYNFARHIVTKACDGFHGNILAHGQTGSGKTHTTLGTENEPGLVLLAFSDIFHYVRTHVDYRFLLRMSYIEIYNDSINCLLGNGTDLKPDTPTSDGVFVPGLTYEFVRSPEDFINLTLRGERKRKVGYTNLNCRSSRSHTILSIIIQSKKKISSSESSSSSEIRCSVLNLVDLAGSENIGDIDNKQRQIECRHINKSLLVLSRVIVKLEKRAKQASLEHIPFRDCKLTRILQPALGGNSNSAIIATLTPTSSSRDESKNTLRFATFACRINNRVKMNVKFDASDELERCRYALENLRRELQRYKHGAQTGLHAQQQVRTLDEKNLQLMQLLQKQKEAQTILVHRIESLQTQLASRSSMENNNNNNNNDIQSLGQHETQVQNQQQNHHQHHQHHQYHQPQQSQEQHRNSLSPGRTEYVVDAFTGKLRTGGNNESEHKIGEYSAPACFNSKIPSTKTNDVSLSGTSHTSPGSSMKNLVSSTCSNSVQRAAASTKMPDNNASLAKRNVNFESESSTRDLSRVNQRVRLRQQQQRLVIANQCNDRDAKEISDEERELQHIATPSITTSTMSLLSLVPVPSAIEIMCIQGVEATKYCNRRMGSHECRVWIDRSDWCVKWRSTRVVQQALLGLLCKKIMLKDMCRVEIGALRSQVFRKNWSADLVRARRRAVTMMTSTRTLNVTMCDDHSVEAFISAFEALVPDLMLLDERFNEEFNGNVDRYKCAEINS